MLSQEEYKASDKHAQGMYLEYDYGKDHTDGYSSYEKDATPPNPFIHPYGYITGWHHARLAAGD